MKFRSGAGLAVLLGAFATFQGAMAVPHVPASNAVVLEVLPRKPGDPLATELRQLRTALAAAPGDAVLAGRLARRYFDLAMADGDPRYVGYAEAVLRPWPEAAAAPAQVLVLRGMLRQYRHDFTQAMAAFELALQADPANTEARAWRAAILMVQANYPGARRECELLAQHASELHATACIAYVDATTGGARAAHERLTAALARRTTLDPDFRLWIETRLAEMSWRAGDPGAAERHFKAALALGVSDNFLLAAYADLLLEQGRAADVLRLLKGWERSDTLLLRLALAAQVLHQPEAQRYSRALGERFADAARRGDRLHLQEEARYLLALKREPRAALATAAENFRTQREPRDALVLLEAALAARDPAAARAALDWLETSGFEGAHLRSVAAQLKALR